MVTNEHIGAAVCKQADIEPALLYHRTEEGRLFQGYAVARARIALVWLLHNRTAMSRDEIAAYMDMTKHSVSRGVAKCENDPVTMRLAEDAWARVERYKAKQRGVA